MKTTFDLVSEFLLEKFGAESMEKDGENQLSLAINERLILIHHFPDSEKLLMAGSIAPLPQEGREKLLLRLMQGQYLFHKTSGMTLSVDPGGTFIALQACMDTRSFSTDDFFTVLNNFVHVAEFWEKECTDGGDTSTTVAGTDEQTVFPAQWMRV